MGALSAGRTWRRSAGSRGRWLSNSALARIHRAHPLGGAAGRGRRAGPPGGATGRGRRVAQVVEGPDPVVRPLAISGPAATVVSLHADVSEVDDGLAGDTNQRHETAVSQQQSLVEDDVGQGDSSGP